VEARAFEARTSDGTLLHGEVRGARGQTPLLLGPHFYPAALAVDATLARWVEVLSEDFLVISADYPRGIGRTVGVGPGAAASVAAELTGDRAARDYECIADAVGAHRFGFLGYSFGGAMGLAVAARSSRVAALAVGGFPPLDAPYALLAEISEEIAEKPPPLPAFVRAEALHGAAHFYRQLASGSERRAIEALAGPRLAFMGTLDQAQGASRSMPLATRLAETEVELRERGWQVTWLEGHDHITALDPKVSLPRVREFFLHALKG